MTWQKLLAVMRRVLLLVLAYSLANANLTDSVSASLAENRSVTETNVSVSHVLPVTSTTTLTATMSHTDSVESATQRASNSHTQPTSTISTSKDIIYYVGPCDAVVAVGPSASKQFLPVSSLVGAAPIDGRDGGGSVPVFVIPAITFGANGGAIVSIRLQPKYNTSAALGTTAPASNNTHQLTIVDNDVYPRFSPAVVQSPSSSFVLMVKDALYASIVDPADDTAQSLSMLAGNSSESHGIISILDKRRGALRASMNSRQNQLDIAFERFISYRVAYDEWVVIRFDERSTTLPSNCANNMQVILHIKAFEYAFPIHGITNAVCFGVLIAGIVASIGGVSLALSQHAGAVSILSLLHYAQEDGRQLPLSISILQVSVGDSKYKYVVGVLVVNSAIVGTVALLHLALVRVILPMWKRVHPQVAQGMLRFPSLTVALVLHLAPGMWYSFGRNSGHLTTEDYVLNFTALALLTSMTWLGFRLLVSSSMSVRYLPHKNGKGLLNDHGYDDRLKKAVLHTVTASDVLLDAQQRRARVLSTAGSSDSAPLASDEHLENEEDVWAALEELEAPMDPLKHRPHAMLLLKEGRHFHSWLRRLFLWLDEEHGEWRSIDLQGTFVASHGHVFINYTKRGRLWMGFEQIDVFLVSLLTVVDNYTQTLGLIQFGLTLAVKVVMYLACVGLKPARRTHTSLWLHCLYLSETIVALALTVGAYRIELLSVTSVVQEVGCFFCACVLLMDTLCTALHAAVLAWMQVRRRSRFVSSSSNQNSAVERFTVRVTDEVGLREGADLVSGMVLGSEAARDALRRQQRCQESDAVYDELMMWQPGGKDKKRAATLVAPAPINLEQQQVEGESSEDIDEDIQMLVRCGFERPGSRRRGRAPVASMNTSRTGLIEDDVPPTLLAAVVDGQEEHVAPTAAMHERTEAFLCSPGFYSLEESDQRTLLAAAARAQSQTCLVVGHADTDGDSCLDVVDRLLEEDAQLHSHRLASGRYYERET